ncbi:MAG: hypothetical protein ACE5LD_02955 [Candidatus Bipolaricaulia bacterium]
MARVEAVIKVGGSLAKSNALEPLCRKISELGQRHRLLIVPGGGPFADVVRTHYQCYRLSETAAHRMAILAMDQYGYLLCDLIPGSLPVTSLLTVPVVCEARRVPVLLVSELLRADPLPHSWAVTSDSIAAWVAGLIKAPLLVLLKDVEGIYTTDPHLGGETGLLAEVVISQLADYGGVDKYLASVLAANEIEAWVISGEHPARLEELLQRGRTRGTVLRRQG